MTPQQRSHYLTLAKLGERLEWLESDLRAAIRDAEGIIPKRTLNKARTVRRKVGDAGFSLKTLKPGNKS